jgi:hypothetical protein
MEIIDEFFDDCSQAKGLAILIKPVRMKSGRILCKSTSIWWESKNDKQFMKEMRQLLRDGGNWGLYDAG